MSNKKKELKKKLKNIDKRTQMFFKDAEAEALWSAAATNHLYEPFFNQFFTYARYWAKLMQVELCTGKTVAEIAEDCASDVAKLIDINDAMFSYALDLLCVFWIYGDNLKALYYGKEKNEQNS